MDLWQEMSFVRSVLIAIFAHLLLTQSVLADQTIEGRVTVVRDVDTIIVAGTVVRLNGVDGPETSTRYGREARAFMTRLVQEGTLTCVLNGERTYDRWVGVCFIDREDTGAIASGFTLHCRRYSVGSYRDLETREARSRLDRASYCK